MRNLVFVLLTGAALALQACGGGAKNPTVRNDIKKQVNDHLALGVESFATGNLQTSLNYLNMALNEARMIDSIPDQISVRINMGSVYIALGQITEASNQIFTAQEMIRFTGIRTYDFNLKIVQGKFYTRINQVDLAVKSYKQALRLAKSPNQQAVAYNNLGIILRKNGDPDDALWHLNRAKVINRSKKFYDQLANNYYNIAEIHFSQEEWAAAKRNYLEALNYDKISENPLGLIEDLKRLGEVSYKLNNSLLGEHYFTRSLNVARAMKNDLKQQEIRTLAEKYRKEAGLKDTDKQVPADTKTVQPDKTSTTPVAPSDKKPLSGSTNSVSILSNRPSTNNL